MAGYGLFILGFAVGTFGTLVGAGGGFILVPLLMFLYPGLPPSQITAISLAVVFFNALSGSWAYAREGRIDYRAGLIFALASFPGSVIGAYSTHFLSRKVFDPIFAVFLISIGLFIFFRQAPEAPHGVPSPPSGGGPKHVYNLPLGIAASALVGFISSFLGLGGGIVHVPVMIHLLNFPVHAATATSHFVLAIIALVGTLVHIYDGSTQAGMSEILWLAPGVLLGAPLGARLSGKLKGMHIVRGLSVALVFVGLRLLWMHF
jgi:uncharacterized membrane protein YfcA